jgi:DNA polymerase V
MVKLTIHKPENETKYKVAIAGSPVHAGFPSPADDFLENRLDLNDLLIKNPSSTFYARVSGESMAGDGINDGDLLVIDKSLSPYTNCMAVCYIDGEFTLKRVKIEDSCVWLIPSNERFKPIKVDINNEFIIWGVVTYIIKRIR